MNQYIGTRLMELSHEQDISQKQLSAQSSIPQITLSRIMSDKQRANREQIKSLAETLNVSVDALTQKHNSPIFHSHNQQGGYANNYFAQDSV